MSDCWQKKPGTTLKTVGVNTENKEVLNIDNCSMPLNIEACAGGKANVKVIHIHKLVMYSDRKISVRLNLKQKLLSLIGRYPNEKQLEQAFRETCLSEDLDEGNRERE